MIITREEAITLLHSALTEEIGLICWASDPREFRQDLYRAQQEDPYLKSLQIRITSEGIAVCHPPIQGDSTGIPLDTGEPLENHNG